MSDRRATLGLIGIVSWLLVAGVGLYHERYMLAGTALVLVSFSIFVWETYR